MLLNKLKDKILTLGVTESLILFLMLILPFLPKVIPPVIIAVFLFSIFEKKFSLPSYREIMRSPLCLLILLFAVYAIGMLYTNQTQEGFSTLERMLLLILFPLFFGGFKPKNQQEFLPFVLQYFIYSVFLAALVCIIIANIYFWYEIYCRENRIILEDYPYTNYFFYSYLSRFMHYGYFSLFVNMAIGIQLWLILKNEESVSGRKKIRQWLTVVFLSVFVLMLYAKAGLITLLLIYVFTLIFFLVRLKNKWITLILAGVFAIVVFFLVKYVPHTYERFMEMRKNISTENLDKTSAESTQIRLLVWGASRELIEASPLTGYGTGDAQENLNKIYKRDGITAALDKNLNAHNQFLQSWIEIGIVGPLLLIGFIVFYFLYAYRNSVGYPALIFLTILVINLLTESTFRTQNGVLFTSLFGCLFVFMSSKEKTN